MKRLNDFYEMLDARVRTRWRAFCDRYTPPGFNVGAEKTVFLVGWVLSFLYSLKFVFHYIVALEQLYRPLNTGGRRLIPGAVITDFYDVFRHAWGGFWILLVVMLIYGIFHYTYFTTDTKSIYLMRRLPDRLERYRRVVTLTLVWVLLCVLSAVLCFVFSYLIYRFATPDECLPTRILVPFIRRLFA